MNFDGFLKHLEGRLKHPFLGPFSISAILVNYPIWIYTFTGNQDAKARIESIAAYLNENSCRGFLIPLIVGLLYMFIYPHIDRHYSKYVTELESKKQSEAKYNFENHNLKNVSLREAFLKKINRSEINLNDLYASLQNAESSIKHTMQHYPAPHFNQPINSLLSILPKLKDQISHIHNSKKHFENGEVEALNNYEF
ncbi:MAG: hypothetical protein JNL11_06080 [Bdellovibrionaceae bacterium]|nr:hypothetical protein [Pseudobdellovibrionaceae bacterium]